jgi:predicted phosphoadenosine phosphosulfate sulfurtransferase
LVRASEFKKITGSALGNYLGQMSEGHKVMAVMRNVSLDEIKNTIWHEIGHFLFKSKPHWWVELYANKMSGVNSYLHFAGKYGKAKVAMPSRKKLLELSRRSAERMKKEEKKNE